ncbi:MAG TPA: class I SAM-dependent methyltransferase [Nitrospirota bacterium]|nr:class I SAM-dependent methyltransferase [Nitrospirota bacterium]
MAQEMKGSCLLCGGRMATVLDKVFDTRFGINASYHIESCNKCEMEQTAPLPAPDELKNLYETYYNFGGEKNTSYTALRERFLFSPFYRFWLALDGDISFHAKKGSGALLDVGCNEGRGLRFYTRNGYTAEGLEFNETAAAVAESQGFSVYTRPLEEYPQLKEKYDVVVLSNVLEHLLDPKRTLKSIKDILKQNGRLWISCPNNKSWLSSVFGKYWINWHVPFHVVHFSASGLRKLLQDSGFIVREIRHETPSLWVAHSIIVRLLAKRGKPTGQLRNPFLVMTLMLLVRGALFPILWIGNLVGRGDCLVVTAYKR